MKKLFFTSILSLICFYFFSVSIYGQATIETGSMGIIVNSYGRIRAYLPDATSGLKQIERISPLVGVNSDGVFDYQNDIDTEEPTMLVENPQLSDFEIYGAYNNAYSSAFPNILVKYNIYSWTNAKYALCKFTFINRESNAINAKIGLDIIMSLNNSYGYDTVSFNSGNQIIRTYRGGVNSGIKLFSHPLQSLISLEWFEDYYVDSNYWNWLNYTSIQNEYISGVEGPITIPSIDFININSGDSVIFYFTFAFGETEQELYSQIESAQNKYLQITDVEDNDISTVNNFELNQNYPNPFNPTTKISWQSPTDGWNSIKIYDILGNEITTLVNEYTPAGKHEIEFNALSFASGVYFYKLQIQPNKTGMKNYVSVKKMIVIK